MPPPPSPRPLKGFLHSSPHKFVPHNCENRLQGGKLQQNPLVPVREGGLCGRVPVWGKGTHLKSVCVCHGGGGLIGVVVLQQAMGGAGVDIAVAAHTQPARRHLDRRAQGLSQHHLCVKVEKVAKLN